MLIRSGVSNRAVRWGFTLVELLVVISIIAMLLAILMPALQKARNSGKNVVCKTREKQILVAMMAYASDYKTSYPWLGDLKNAWSSWGSYGMVTDATTSGPGYLRGIGILLAYGYIGNDPEFYYCPGRDKKVWPASYLFDKTSGWVTAKDGKPGVKYPRSACYNLRGWKDNPSEWKAAVNGRRALTSDIFVNYHTAVEPHKNGLNVGYSDGSVTFAPGNTKLPSDRKERGYFDVLKEWSPAPPPGVPIFVSITVAQHHTIYSLFDQ